LFAGWTKTRSDWAEASDFKYIIYSYDAIMIWLDDHDTLPSESFNDFVMSSRMVHNFMHL
jgi:hypothetical protein